MLQLSSSGLSRGDGLLGRGSGLSRGSQGLSNGGGGLHQGKSFPSWINDAIEEVFFDLAIEVPDYVEPAAVEPEAVEPAEALEPEAVEKISCGSMTRGYFFLYPLPTL